MSKNNRNNHFIDFDEDVQFTRENAKKKDKKLLRKNAREQEQFVNQFGEITLDEEQHAQNKKH